MTGWPAVVRVEHPCVRAAALVAHAGDLGPPVQSDGGDADPAPWWWRSVLYQAASPLGVQLRWNRTDREDDDVRDWELSSAGGDGAPDTEHGTWTGNRAGAVRAAADLGEQLDRKVYVQPADTEVRLTGR
jgi:hypothetical protein